MSFILVVSAWSSAACKRAYVFTCCLVVPEWSSMMKAYLHALKCCILVVSAWSSAPLTHSHVLTRILGRLCMEFGNMCTHICSHNLLGRLCMELDTNSSHALPFFVVVVSAWGSATYTRTYMLTRFLIVSAWSSPNRFVSFSTIHSLLYFFTF